MFRLSKAPQTYLYTPLLGESDVRYLVLRPGKGCEPLWCDLYSSAIAKLRDFEAISYVWGSSNKTARVWCDGRTIPITANLRDVLRRVRLPNAPRKLWADLICINQENSEEQGHQVKLMGQIYKQASRTVIYLGPDHGQGSSAASLLGEVSKMIKSQLQEFGSWDEVPSLDPEDPIARDPRWSAVSKMIFLPWFSRVWVVQEAALSKDAIVLYGWAEFQWSTLLQTHRWIFSKSKFLLDTHELYLNDIHQPDLWTMGKPNPTQFVGALARAKILQCSDARDRVYAFLGLPLAKIGLESRPIIEPNYSKTYLEVYQELALEFLRCTNDLSLLSAVDHTSRTLKSDLPSWVPRWDCAVTRQQLGLHGSQFNASRGTSQKEVGFVSSTVLRLRGFVVDFIFRSEDLSLVVLRSLFTIWEGLSRQSHSFWRSISPRMRKLLNSLSRLAPEKKDPFIKFWRYLSNPTTRCRYGEGWRLRALLKTLRVRPHDEDLTADEAAFGLWLCQQSGCFEGVDIAELEQAAEGGDSATFMTPAVGWYEDRRFALTKDGYYGLVPKPTREGDVCCIISGLRVPVILRRTGKKEQHCKLVGEAFIFGLMEGQAFDNFDNRKLQEQDFIVC